jgi:hypothetical protein
MPRKFATTAGVVALWGELLMFAYVRQHLKNARLYWAKKQNKNLLSRF